METRSTGSPFRDNIGLPHHFSELEFFGWHPRSGFQIFQNLSLVDLKADYLFQMENLDNELRNFFHTLSLSPEHLSDEQSRNFIYNFLDCFGPIHLVIDDNIVDGFEVVNQDDESARTKLIQEIQEWSLKDGNGVLEESTVLLLDILHSADHLRTEHSAFQAYYFVFRFWQLKGKLLWMTKQEHEYATVNLPETPTTPTRQLKRPAERPPAPPDRRLSTPERPQPRTERPQRGAPHRRLARLSTHPLPPLPPENSFAAANSSSERTTVQPVRPPRRSQPVSPPTSATTESCAEAPAYATASPVRETCRDESIPSPPPRQTRPSVPPRRKTQVGGLQILPENGRLELESVLARRKKRSLGSEE